MPSQSGVRAKGRVKCQFSHGKKEVHAVQKREEEENEDGQLSVMQKEKETKENHGEKV
jgi:hypothetical protein